MGLSDQDFLARIAARLGRTAPPAEVARAAAPPLRAIGPTDLEVLAERFTAELERVGGVVTRAGAPAQAADLAVSILQTEGVSGTVVCWDDPWLADLGVTRALEAAGYRVRTFGAGSDRSELLQECEQAAAGITGCDAAIAETGTLALTSAGRARVISLLPPLHLAIIRREQLVFSALAVMRDLAAGPLPAQVVFASGPSRSADIEGDLAIGVHGPGRAHVLII